MTPLVKNKEHVIFHLNNSIHVKLGLEARKRFNAKVVYTLHFLPGYLSWIDINGGIPEDMTLTGSVLGREAEMMREADGIICVTRFAQRMIVDHYDCPLEKTIVISNGYDGRTNVIPIQKDRKQIIRNKLGFGENERIILYVGRLDSAKGIRQLLQSFNKISSYYRECRLVLAGSGNYAEVLKYAVNNWGRITFTGWLFPQDLEQFYIIADIGVIPSVYEQCSYVALEMMRYGLPVIASGVPGLNELFTDHENSLIVPVYKQNNGLLELGMREEDLFKALKILLDDVGLRIKLGKNAHAQWKRYYTADHMGKATLKEYQDLFAK
jgi:glycosyltransferase involved in cell wall biosynthesis